MHVLHVGGYVQARWVSAESLYQVHHPFMPVGMCLQSLQKGYKRGHKAVDFFGGGFGEVKTLGHSTEFLQVSQTSLIM